MLGAPRIVDPITRAKRIEAVGKTGMSPPRQCQRVDGAIERDCRAADALQFGVQKAHVEFGIVNDELGVANKREEFVRHLLEERLAGQEFAREAVHLVGRLRHVALRIDVAVEDLPGRDAIVELDAADLDETMPVGRIESGRLGIEDDLPHLTPFGRTGRQWRAGWHAPGARHGRSRNPSR